MCVVYICVIYVCFFGIPYSPHNRSADKNSSHQSTLSARFRDRSVSFERRQAATRGHASAPRPIPRSRSGSRERSQTEEISKTLSRLRVLSPASGNNIRHCDDVVAVISVTRALGECKLLVLKCC